MDSQCTAHTQQKDGKMAIQGFGQLLPAKHRACINETQGKQSATGDGRLDNALSTSLNLNMSQLPQLDPQLQQQLSALTNASWQTQIQIITSLPHNLQLIRLINHRNYSSDIASLLIATNPRSKLVLAVVDFIVALFSLFCNQLRGFANLLVSSDCLLHLLNSGNKVVASAANEALKAIISNTSFKEKGKLIKYVHVLQQQFLCSKNSYVREKISLYFQLIVVSGYYNKETLIDFQRKVVKVGLEDACEKVRKNMRKVLQNATNFQKENAFIYPTKEIAAKNSSPQVKALDRKSIAKGKARVVYSSVKQSSILQSFREETEQIRSRPEQLLQSPSNAQANESSYRFYLERLKAGGPWTMLTIAYEEVVNCISSGWLAQINNETLYSETIKQMMPFLAEKRSKIYDSCHKVFVQLLNNIKQEQLSKATSYLEENCSKFVEYAVRIESVGTKLLPILLELKPWFFVVKLAEVSLQLKVSRQKIMVLDSILRCLPLVEEQAKAKRNKKVAALVKTMCQHVVLGNGKDRQINFAALAIISQLKSLYSEEVLSTLLSQHDKVLTKIIELAESIDHTLKQAVIQYIASFKTPKTASSHPKSANSQQIYALQIQSEIKLIMEGKSSTLNTLGFLYLTHLQKISEEQFMRLLGTLQHLNERDMLMELKIVLTEIAKQGNLRFLRAVTKMLSSNDYPIEPIKQHHVLLYLQVIGVALKSSQPEEEQLSQVASVLVSVYRKQHSVKIRNLVIQNLTVVSESVLLRCANEKELELIRVYRDHLFQDELSDSQHSEYLTNSIEAGQPAAFQE